MCLPRPRGQSVSQKKYVAELVATDQLRKDLHFCTSDRLFEVARVLFPDIF
jgi:hypothetical protein